MQTVTNADVQYKCNERQYTEITNKIQNEANSSSGYPS